MIRFLCYIYLIFFTFGFGSARANSAGLNGTTYKLDNLQELQDSVEVGEDSLNELVPYVDRVKTQNRQKEQGIYILLIGLATLISEDLAGIGAGLMAAHSMIPFAAAAAGVGFFILLFDSILYFIGRTLGMRVFRLRPFSWFLKEDHLMQAERWFNRKGPVLLVISRFIPGSRIPVYLASGMMKTKFSTFCLYFGLPVILWTPILVGLSKVLGEEMLQFYRVYESKALWVMIVMLFLIIWFFKLILPRIRDYLNAL